MDDSKTVENINDAPNTQWQAKRVLVAGGRGLLAGALGALSTPERPIVALGRDELDIADRDSVLRAIEEHHPDTILNPAAMTNVDACERDLDAAYRANSIGPKVLAEACREAGIRLMHFSTDFVFDGEKREPYTFEDEPRPLSVYGASKLAGENAVRETLPDAIVVRVSWVYGPGGKNFLSRLFEYADQSGTLRGITDMRSAPTYAPELAARSLEIAQIWEPGIYHVTGAGDASWFEVAQTALELAGRTDVELLPVTAEELGLPAPRPKYSVLRCLVSERLGLPPMRPWRDALAEYVAGIGR